jgi:uncharacterized protein with NRDE domain
MCLIAFAWQRHPAFRLLLVGNRDERHDRPAKALQWWPDHPDLLAGRDLQAGGTWLAVSRHGRFATVTNYREPEVSQRGLRSRGGIVQRFVAGTASPQAFAAELDGNRYAGFSLLFTDGHELWYLSNRGDPPRQLEAGVYGLSNAALDTPWPKVIRSRAGLQQLIDDDRINREALIRLLQDRAPAPAGEVDFGEIPFDVARLRSAPFIVAPEYGTRCTSALLWTSDGEITLAERRFDADGRNVGETAITFSVNQARATS